VLKLVPADRRDAHRKTLADRQSALCELNLQGQGETVFSITEPEPGSARRDGASCARSLS
jgi:hypothetical protein